MHDITAICGEEAEDTADQWLKVDNACDSGFEWQVVRNRNQRKSHVEFSVENFVHRSCGFETRDRTNTGTMLASVLSASSVSPGMTSEILPEELNVACWK